LNSNLSIYPVGYISPDVRLLLANGGMPIPLSSAARQSVAAVSGDGVNIALYNHIGGGRAPAPSDVAGRTPDGTLVSPYIDFPNPGLVINVGNSFNSFFASTATPPAQVSGLAASNFILQNT